MTDETREQTPGDPSPQPSATEVATEAESPAERSGGDARRVLLLWAGAAVLLISAAAGWYWYARPSKPTPLAVERLLRERKYQDAERLARQLYESSPQNPGYAFLLARVLAANEKLKEAAELLEGLQVEGVDRAEALLRAGQCWLQAALRRKAEATFEACLTVRADDTIRLPAIQLAARRELAGIFATERRTPEFRRVTWEIFEESAPQEKASALASRIRYAFEMVEPRFAIATLEPAVQADPADVYSRRAIGFYYLELGDANAARPYLIRCVQDAPDNPLVWETWLHCLVRVADTILAERYLKEIPPAVDSSPLAWRYRAQLLDLLNRTDEAVEAAKRAVELDPYDPENHYQYAQMLIRANRRDEAEAHVQRSQELQNLIQQLRDLFERFRQEWPRVAEAQERCELAIELGQLCEQLGRVRDAYGWYSVALHEVPNHAGAIEARNRLEEKLLDADLPY